MGVYTIPVLQPTKSRADELTNNGGISSFLPEAECLQLLQDIVINRAHLQVLSLHRMRRMTRYISPLTCDYLQKLALTLMELEESYNIEER